MSFIKGLYKTRNLKTEINSYVFKIAILYTRAAVPAKTPNSSISASSFLQCGILTQDNCWSSSHSMLIPDNWMKMGKNSKSSLFQKLFQTIYTRLLLITHWLTLSHIASMIQQGLEI